jgi:hypothetical protein
VVTDFLHLEPFLTVILLLSRLCGGRSVVDIHGIHDLRNTERGLDSQAEMTVAVSTGASFPDWEGVHGFPRSSIPVTSDRRPPTAWTKANIDWYFWYSSHVY